MATTSISFNTDDAVKKTATEIFSQFGLNMTSGLNLLLHAVIREGGIRFAVENEPGVEYETWMKAKLDESWERRKDPKRKRYAPEAVWDKLGLDV